MSEIIFIYDSNSTAIQYNQNESIKDICQKFVNKAGINFSTVYFLYNGKKIDFQLPLNELIKEDDIKANKITFLVYSNENENENQNQNGKINFESSKEIICPKCGTNCLINANGYKITFYECKNGHKLDDILLDEFQKSQNVDRTKIICDNCKEINKDISYNNIFYKCLKCYQNLCPLCKSKHAKEHDIIDYDQKNCICFKHNEKFNSYCLKCKDNLCMFCESEHLDIENLKYYRDILPRIDLMKTQMNELRINIDKYKEMINELKKIINKIIENMEIYYNINDNLIKNYEKRIRNYQNLKNINEIINNNKIVINNLIYIKSDNYITKLFNNSLNIYNKMINESIDKNQIINNEKISEIKDICNNMREILNKEITPHLKDKHNEIFYTYVKEWNWLETNNKDWKWWWWGKNPWWKNSICNECNNLWQKYENEIEIHERKRIYLLEKEQLTNICNNMRDIFNKEITPHLKEKHNELFNTYVKEWNWLETNNKDWKWWRWSKNQRRKNSICNECNNLWHKYENEIEVYEKQRICLIYNLKK